MRTYRHDSKRENDRRRQLQRHEALIAARARFAENCYALASGSGDERGVSDPPVALAGRLVLARRLGRVVAGAVLLIGGALTGAMIALSPEAFLPVLAGTWLSATVSYFAARALVTTRERRRAHDEAHTAIVVRLARSLETPSAVVPGAGLLLAVTIPLGWLVFTIGVGWWPPLMVMFSAAYAGWTWMRACSRSERVELDPDAPRLTGAAR